MRILLLVTIGLTLAGCSWHRKAKPSTHVYSGDGPKTRMFDKPEAAGGELNTY